MADADGGVPEHAPYDCVIATTSAWDIPPAWTDQLAEQGRIVVPLRAVLDQPRVTAWSGITIVSNEPHDGLWLRLTVTDSLREASRNASTMSAGGATLSTVSN